MNDQPIGLGHRFTYHQPTPEQPEVFQLLRDAAYHLALLIEASTKPGQEQTSATNHVEEAVMWANAAIARHGLADPAYAGAADLHDQVLTQLAAERPGSALVNLDEKHWTPAAASDPWQDKPSYLLLELALRAVQTYAHRGGDKAVADYCTAILENRDYAPLPDPGEALCQARPRGPGLRLPVGCDRPRGHDHGPHSASYDTGHDGWTSITWDGEGN